MKVIKTIKRWVNPNQQSQQFNERLHSNYTNLYRLAYSWAQQKPLAQDLVQETMLKAIEKNYQLKQLNEMTPWLCKIMHNLYIDKLRYDHKWLFVEETEIDNQIASPSSEDSFIEEQTHFNIHQAIGQLSAGQREIITLVDLQGLSYQQTSEILDIPVGTVMSRLSRARNQLKVLLKPEQKDSSKKDNVVYLEAQK
ncbi:RNA polymerase sigma factor [Thiomicrospira pelophila]|uniref:RNA polymerase sigma factor n=1 Tax=Thiomicrospira pelophila TaxID=934 RepID=UPI0004A6D6AA|nr:RNA polymerase sigma factor [Thiomicrospira pelophila]